MLRVNNLTGFGGGRLLDVTVTDDGDSNPDSGTGTTIHTYNSKSSTKPYTVLVLTATDSTSARTFDSITWNGNAVTRLVQIGSPSDISSCIAIISGSQSGNIVVTFDSNCDDSVLTILSLENLSSIVAVDTDTATGNGAASATMSALAAPGNGGVRIGAYAHNGSTTAVTWTWSGHTEAADVSGGLHRHGVAYKIANESSNITAGPASGTDDISLCGVSLR